MIVSSEFSVLVSYTYVIENCISRGGGEHLKCYIYIYVDIGGEDCNICDF